MFVGKNVKSFSYSFCDCEDLIFISDTLFKYCPNVTDFSGCFGNGCLQLLEIPENLFKYCSKVTDFSNCFYVSVEFEDYLLKNVPFSLFDNCKEVTDFSGCFGNRPEIITTLPDVWNKQKFPKVTRGGGYASVCIKAANYNEIPDDFK